VLFYDDFDSTFKEVYVVWKRLPNDALNKENGSFKGTKLCFEVRKCILGNISNRIWGDN